MYSTYYMHIFYIFYKKLLKIVSLTMTSTTQCIDNSSIIKCTLCKQTRLEV